MIKAHAKLQNAAIRAVVTRADGSIEDRGIIAYYNRNPLKRFAWRLCTVPIIGVVFRPYFR